MKITIEQSPYGDTGAVYEGALGMMQHFKLQLESFRHPDKSPEDAKALEDDILGYVEILNSKSEKNADNFLRLKAGDRVSANRRFSNNLDVIKHLKDSGLWIAG
jgi:hypothetical protein